MLISKKEMEIKATQREREVEYKKQTVEEIIMNEFQL